jgi:hypothetical protein
MSDFAPLILAEALTRRAADPALRDEIAYMPQGFGLYRDIPVSICLTSPDMMLDGG